MRGCRGGPCMVARACVVAVGCAWLQGGMHGCGGGMRGCRGACVLAGGEGVRAWDMTRYGQ